MARAVKKTVPPSPPPPLTLSSVASVNSRPCQNDTWNPIFDVIDLTCNIEYHPPSFSSTKKQTVTPVNDDEATVNVVTIDLTSNEELTKNDYLPNNEVTNAPMLSFVAPKSKKVVYFKTANNGAQKQQPHFNSSIDLSDDTVNKTSNSTKKI